MTTIYRLAPTAARRGALDLRCSNRACSSSIATLNVQRNHWTKHKKDCKLRAAELCDESLFKDPPPKEDCPICFLPGLICCVSLQSATISSCPNVLSFNTSQIQIWGSTRVIGSSVGGRGWVVDHWTRLYYSVHKVFLIEYTQTFLHWTTGQYYTYTLGGQCWLTNVNSKTS
jgi:hypothetical protein